MTGAKPRRPNLIVPNSNAAILLDVEDQEDEEFSIADRIHLHRLADVHCGLKSDQVCHIERKCHQCGMLNHVPVTSRKGKRVGTTGAQRCENCGFVLFTLEAVNGRVNIIDRGSGIQVMFYAVDAMRTWKTHLTLSIGPQRRASDAVQALPLLKKNITA